ncbi:MAG: response regulator transcription factor [Chloroflexota bacterium]
MVADDPETVDLLTVGFLFQWQGAVVVPAADAREGVDAFLRHSPQLIVLDTSLPDGSSFALLGEVRQLSAVPVILLTAPGSEEDEVRGLELGADACVAKPFSSLAFLARVKAILRRAEAPPPPATPPRLRKRMVSGDPGK